MKLQGRNAIITGSGRGYGAALAAQFWAEGASLLLCARSADELEAVKRQLSAQERPGQRLLTKVTDMSEIKQIDSLIDLALSSFPHVDVLINNAGISSSFGWLEEIDWSRWEATIAVNLIGAVYACRRVVPAMRARKYGKIVNICGGGVAVPSANRTAYAVSKAGLAHFSELLALETADAGIDVNAVLPGGMKTRMLDNMAAADPNKVGKEYVEHVKQLLASEDSQMEEPVAMVTWLASADSDGISGRLIHAKQHPWRSLTSRREELMASDIYTLRLVTPKDRGKSWT